MRSDARRAATIATALALLAVAALPRVATAATAKKIDAKVDAALQKLYAFFFDKSGLMAGIGLQESKTTRITPDP